MNRSQKAITRIDLIVLIAAFSFIIQAALPALQVARESARRQQCSENLRVISAGIQSHLDSQGYYPSGGWGQHWLGEPERGTGIDQPGGWIFNTLSYIDQVELRNAGLDMTGPDRHQAIKERCQTPLSTFICPSRRETENYPFRRDRLTLLTIGGKIKKLPGRVAKSDYAACSGSIGKLTSFKRLGFAFPKSLEEGDAEEFIWPGEPEFKDKNEKIVKFNGIIYGRSATKLMDIKRGLSQTILLGEKQIRLGFANNGKDEGDRLSMYSGFCEDSCRSTSKLASPDKQMRWSQPHRFGSAHPYVWQAVMADGSVREISYDIDKNVFWPMGNINRNESKLKEKKEEEEQTEEVAIL